MRKSYLECWKETYSRIVLNERGEMGPGGIIGFVILIPIVLILMSTLFPTAFNNIYAADTQNWTVNGQPDQTTTNLWFLIPAIICIVSVIAFLKWSGII